MSRYPVQGCARLARHLAWHGAVSAALAVMLLVPGRAHAASLMGPISGWASGVPGYVSMYEYVPAALASKAPILVVSHYCSGSAAGVFGEAQGGGLVSAADRYGFLMIFPQTSNNCWDVGSTQSLTHDGGGDTQAIAEMVKYEISHRSVDPNRVYATGTSSGAMMTEALLAVYPDIFKAGAEFSGVPAGCWSVNDSNGQWSSPCAGGMVSHTPQEWGDLVRAMYPGYSGYRPRIQLWHGTADTTINFNNQTEAIKEWTNVLGLGDSPTSTDSPTFNNHSWSHQSWQDACGFTLLETWSEQNGPHGTDANLNATYVIPFFGLDKTGPDPQVGVCSEAGAPDSGARSSDAGGATDGSQGALGSDGGSVDASSGLVDVSNGSSNANGGSGSASSIGDASSGGSKGGTGEAGSMAEASSGPSSSGGAGGTGGSSDWSQGNSSPHSGCGCGLPPGGEGTRAAAFVAASLLGITLRRRRRGVGYGAVVTVTSST